MQGGLFHGEPTVGLQSNIPLSRRVQLAVLAHIRHTHTRYDLLLRETSWMNARKAVEPVCLDVLVRWRGDEETGRDQMDEILREVVIITDSEDSDDSSEEDDSSDDDDEFTSGSSGAISQPNSRNQVRPNQHLQPQVGKPHMVMRPMSGNQHRPQHQSMHDQPNIQRNKKTQRGFSRYQAAWDQAVSRQEPPKAPVSSRRAPSGASDQQHPPYGASSSRDINHHSPPKISPRPQYINIVTDQPRYQDTPMVLSEAVSLNPL